LSAFHYALQHVSAVRISLSRVYLFLCIRHPPDDG